MTVANSSLLFMGVDFAIPEDRSLTEMLAYPRLVDVCCGCYITVYPVEELSLFI